MKLGQFFDDSEFGHDLSQQVLQNYYLLVLWILDPVREVFGPVTITSGFRTIADQERLTSQDYHPSPTSQHLFGEAADFICKGQNMKEVYDWICHRGWLGELFYYSKRGHVHVALPRIGLKTDRGIIDT